jgi:hypothetical protein
VIPKTYCAGLILLSADSPDTVAPSGAPVRIAARHEG